MVNTYLLRRILKLRGYTYKKAGAVLGIQAAGFQKRIVSGHFGLDDANALVAALKIKQPAEVFFASSCTYPLKVRPRIRSK